MKFPLQVDATEGQVKKKISLRIKNEYFWKFFTRDFLRACKLWSPVVQWDVLMAASDLTIKISFPVWGPLPVIRAACCMAPAANKCNVLVTMVMFLLLSINKSWIWNELVSITNPRNELVSITNPRNKLVWVHCTCECFWSKVFFNWGDMLILRVFFIFTSFPKDRGVAEPSPCGSLLLI